MIKKLRAGARGLQRRAKGIKRGILGQQIKQVIVLRTDLKLSKGKSAAQASHAAVSAYLESQRISPDISKAWLSAGQKKVVLAVSTVTELENLKKEAKMENLPASLIIDAGFTELPPGTVTALGLGPAEDKELDRLTGHLTLY